MGFLKRFRARLSMEKEAAKIPEMTGLYRRVSFSEMAIQKNAEVSAAPSSITSDSTTSDDNETVQCDHSKVNITSQSSSASSSSIIDSEEMMVKDNDKAQINNYIFENVKPSTSKDANTKEQLTRGEESNKITKDQNDMSFTKSPICSDNELVI